MRYVTKEELILEDQFQAFYTAQEEQERMTK